MEIGYNIVPNGLTQITQRDVYILHYVIGGKGVLLDHEFDNNCGYVIVPNELEIIQGDSETPYETYWITFRGVTAKSLLRDCGIPRHNGVFTFDKNLRCAEILKETLFNITPANEYEEAYLMLSAFYKIISLHMQDKSKNSTAADMAHAVMEFINTNYYKQIKISDLAEMNNYTRNYLSTLFKKEYNISPQDYLLSLRIEKAKVLLSDKSNDFSINEIAFATGFNDPLYFSRIFHKKTGVSPTEFKNNLDK